MNTPRRDEATALNPIADPPRRAIALCAAVLFTLTLVAFFPALSAGFVKFDDPEIITANENFRGLGAANLRWMFTTNLLGHYQPLTWISYAIDHALWGMNPTGYHLTSILLHAINGVLVFLLALRLLRAAAPAAGHALIVGSLAAAALFALHPLRVESVAWVTERRDVLSAALLLASMLAYLRAVRPGAPGLLSRGWYAACIGLLVLSLLSKAWGMSMFALCLIVDAYPLRRVRATDFGSAKSVLRLVIEKLPLITLGIAAAAMAAHAQNSVLAAKTLADWTVKDRIVQAVYGLAFYPRTTLIPTNLAALYAIPKSVDPAELRFVLAYIMVAGAAVLAFATARRFPAILAAILAYGVLISPVLGFAQSGDQLVADRYSYLATIPLAILIGGAAAWGWRVCGAGGGSRRAWLAAGGAAAALLLIAATRSQCRVWRDNESLWRQAVLAAPSVQTHTNLAVELASQRRFDEAEKEFLAGLLLEQTNGYAWFRLGDAYAAHGKFDNAILAYGEAVKYMPQKFGPLVNMGAVYMNHAKDLDKAIECYRAAVRDVEQGGRRLLSALPYLSLGHALALKGDVEGARANFTKALESEDTRADAEKELKALDAKGVPGEAGGTKK